MAHASRSGIALLAALAAACAGSPPDPGAELLTPSLRAVQRASMAVAETAVAAGPELETAPALGRDAAGPFVAWVSRSRRSDGTFGPGSIWYQRLAGGAPAGAPVLVSAGGSDDELPDVSGGRIVYTAWTDPSASLAGRVVVYDVATGARATVAEAPAVGRARISGDRVAWLQGEPGAAILWLYDLAALGTGAPATWIAGPAPSPVAIDVGPRFVVWDELAGAQRNVRAYDLAEGTRSAVASRPELDERTPTTDGAWIAWEERPSTGTATRICALDPATGEARVIASDGAANAAPALSGDLLAWQRTAGGSAEVHVYRLSAGDAFPVTAAPADPRAPAVVDGLVAWADVRSGGSDVYVATLDFASDPGIPGTPLDAVDAAIAAVAALDPAAFARPTLQLVLVLDLSALRRMVEAGATAGALEKLRHDLAAKADGCAARGAPDANDWVLDCEAQRAVQDALRDVVTALKRGPARR